MIKQFFLAIFLVFIFNNDVTAQRNHGVYLELGGAGLFYSLNYDVRMLDQNDGLGLRAGLSISPEFFGSGIDRIIPVQLNYLLGKKKHQFEMGFGGTYINTKGIEGEKTQDVFTTGTLAYRFQTNHFMFRAGFTSFLYKHDSDLVIHPFWPGISFGYTF